MLTRPLTRSLTRPLTRPLIGNGEPPTPDPPIITGTPYPGETLISTQAGQWLLNGSPVSGETGTTFEIPYTVEPGDEISQAGSNVMEIPDFESAATDFFSRLAAQSLTPSPPRRWAYNSFLLAGASNGWLPHIIEMYAFEGATLAQAAEKLIYRAGYPTALTNNGYTTAGLRAEGGLKMTGTTAYWSTFNSSTMPSDLYAVRAMMREPIYGVTAVTLMGVSGTPVSMKLDSFFSAGQQYYKVYGGTGASFGAAQSPGRAVGPGLISAERKSLSLVRLVKNGALMASNTDTVSTGGVASPIRVAQAPAPMDMGIIDDGLMTDADVLVMQSDIQTLMHALGRVESLQDTNYVVVTGQSLAIGAVSGSPLSTTPNTNHQHRTSHRGVYTGTTSNTEAFCFSSLREFSLESIATEFTNTVGTLHREIVPGDPSQDLVITTWAQGGFSYNSLKKGTTHYNAAIAAITSGKRIHDLTRSGIFRVHGILCVHGEADSSSATYGADIATWQADYEADSIAITGQSGIIPMFHSQPSSLATGAESPQQILSAHIANPTRTILVCAKYFLTHADGIHLTNTSYRTLGGYYAKAWHQHIILGVPYTPLRPSAISRSGAVITLSFAGRVGSLVLDTTNVSDPGNYGFEWAQTGGSAQTISSVDLINGDTQIQITLTGDPGSPSAENVRYAYTGTASTGGPTTGPRGCLRDSDSTENYNGDPMPNWLVHFNFPVGYSAP